MNRLELTTRESFSSPLYAIEAFSNIGTCEVQEDAVGCFIEGNTAVMVLCDGIGGLERGELASGKAVQTILDCARKYEWKENPRAFLEYLVEEANRAVFDLADEENIPLQGGCTLVLLLAVGRRVYWANVGDSRAYIIKKDEMYQMTEDHNYSEQLKKELRENKLSAEEYETLKTKGAALTSYLGMGELKERSVCKEPLLMDREEVILVESDGLYKLLEEEQIRQIVRKNVRCLDMVGEELLGKAKEHVRNYQDNTSIILFRMK